MHVTTDVDVGNVLLWHRLDEHGKPDTGTWGVEDVFRSKGLFANCMPVSSEA